MTNTINPALPLLHKADELSRQFTSLHNESVNYVTSLRIQASQQHNLLLFLQSKSKSKSKFLLESSSHYFTLKKLQDQTEIILSQLRDPILLKMDTLITEDFRSLLFSTETYLSNNQLDNLPHLSNPRSSLSYISHLYDMYQAEIERKRELLADLMMFTEDNENGNENISLSHGNEWLHAVEHFEKEWKIMKHVQGAQEEEMGDLLNVLDKWNHHDINQDIAMD